jgi:hypothetical protein
MIPLCAKERLMIAALKDHFRAIKSHPNHWDDLIALVSPYSFKWKKNHIPVF